MTLPLRRRMARLRPRIASLPLALVVALSSAAGAQEQANPPSAVLISGRELALGAGALAATVGVSLVDVKLARMFSDTGFHLRHPGFTSAALRASRVTETVLMISGGLVYGVARLTHDQGTADVAFHATESVLMPAMFIQVIRGTLGRARPYVIDEAGEKRDADPYDFEIAHGFTSFNYRSWPSMHAMASMAVASALAQEMRRRDTPHRKVIAPALYTAAIMPSLARMYLDEHWASDIAMGVYLGIFAGQKVVMYSHDHPDNRIDHTFLRPQLRATIVRDARGFSLSILPF
jgi:membrane-associated phospholipid phosphatase